MADVNTPDASVSTNASNQTQYFNLPLFIATDKPSWLVDWNGAMNEIDKILNDIATASEGAVADVATIQTQINTLSTTVTSLNATVQTAVEDVAAMQTTVQSHETRMDTIEGDLITQNNLIKALSTSVTTMQGTVASLNTAVETMQTTLAGYDTRIDAAEDAATAAQTAVAGIQSTVQSLSSTVAGHTTAISQHTSQISGLDGRVTTLEQVDSVPFPAFDLSVAHGSGTPWTHETRTIVPTTTHGTITGQYAPSHDDTYWYLKIKAVSTASGGKALISVNTPMGKINLEAIPGTANSGGVSTVSPWFKTDSNEAYSYSGETSSTDSVEVIIEEYYQAV